MPELNFCSACRRDYASLRAFDRHRVGAYPQAGPGDYRERLWRGLVDAAEDWRPDHGRRCLDEDELLAAGMEIDPRGRWRLAGDAARIREYRELGRAA